MVDLVVPPIDELINNKGQCSVVYMDEETALPTITRHDSEITARKYGHTLLASQTPFRIYDPLGKCIS